MAFTDYYSNTYPLNFRVNGMSIPPLAVGGGSGTSQSLFNAVGSQVFYVNSAVTGAADARGKGIGPGAPFKTLNFALTQTINNNGDYIYVGPGHVETVSAAAGLTFPTATAAGVTVVFLGNEVDRGTINFATSTAATITVPAANVTLINPLITNSIDARVDGFIVSGADFSMIGAEWRDGSATNGLINIRTTSAGTRMSIIGLRYFEDQVGGGTTKTEFVRVVGGAFHRFIDCNIMGSFSTGTFNNITTLTTSVLFKNTVLGNTNAANLCIAILTTSTGYIQGSLLSYTATHAITTSHILSADMASGQCVPGATPTVIGHA